MQTTWLLAVGTVLMMQAASGDGGAGPPLRALAEAHGLRIGVAVNPRALARDAAYREVLARECSVVTPENAMKWAALRPAQDRFAFENAEAIVTFAETHGMRVRGHTLVWHEAMPAWLEKGDYGREELLELLRTHIQTVVGHFRGRVFAWDVINEGLANDGSLRESFWLKGIGPEYIDLAFRWAREADPDALLFYNDFVAEGGGRRSKAIYRFVKGLTERGVPIDGVGLQMHLKVDDRPNKWHVIRAMRRFESLGLQVHITELDVRLRTPASEDALRRQARLYADLVRIARNRTSCTDVVIWGLDDGHSWIPHFFRGWGEALLFDATYRPKPAYHAVADVLRARP